MLIQVNFTIHAKATFQFFLQYLKSYLSFHLNTQLYN